MKNQFERIKTISKNGFTLIELMIVIVIIGVLASLVMPRFAGQQEKARAGEAINMLAALRKAELSYFDANGAFAPTINAPHGDPTNATSFQNNLNITMPACLCPGGAATGCVAENRQCDWLYSVRNFNGGSMLISGFGCAGTCRVFDGAALAIRTYRARPASMGATTRNILALNPDGSWCGCGDYAPGGPYAPR